MKSAKNHFLKSLVLIFILNSCNSSNPDLQTELKPKSYSVVSINGITLDSTQIEKGLPWLKFGEENKLTGFSGCNTFAGTYRIDDKNIHLEVNSITKMMCYDVPEIEFLDALKKADIIVKQKNKLMLFHGETEVLKLILKDY